MKSVTVKKPGIIKAQILNWLGVPAGLSDIGFWASHSSSNSASGQTVNEQTMLQLSAVWACVRLISGTISTLPLNLYERTSNGRAVAGNHSLQSIIHSRPNVDSTACIFWESNIAAALLQGNGHSEILKIGDRVVGLNFLIPCRLSITKTSDGKCKYVYTENGKQREIPANKIFKIPGFSVNGKTGLSAIQYGANVFGSAMAASESSSATFKNGLMPTVYFKMASILKKEQREDFRANLKSVKGSINAGESPLLEGGMEADTIGINPNDAQLLESRSFSVEEICRWFLVDPSLVGHGGNVSNYGTGLEQKMIGFITFTLRSWLTRIEQAINKDLLTPAEQVRYYAEYSIEGLLRGDSAARASFYSTMTQNGIYTRDDCREKENLPREGGNAAVLTVQSNLVPIDMLGKTTPSQTAKAALQQWLHSEGATHEK